MKYFLVMGNDVFGCVRHVFNTKEEAFAHIKKYPHDWWKLIEGKRIHFEVIPQEALIVEEK